jgi:hypothetical protein
VRGELALVIRGVEIGELAHEAARSLGDRGASDVRLADR